MLTSISSCTSDQNPFDTNILTPTETTDVAKIRLRLDVASTRADDDLSTNDEKKVAKVSIYVFDEHDQLEKFKKDIAVSTGSPAELEVTPGQKTVYAIASKSMMSESLSTGISITKFEQTVFSSTLADLKTSDGFVMVGKSDKQQVLKSANENEVPTSNIFNVSLVRLLAKTQVKFTDVDVSSFGFSYSNPTFCVCQTNDKMRLVADQSKDILSSYVDSNGDGTYDGYTVCHDTDYKKVVTSAFTANGCHYVTENIVQNPVAGNTTFVSLCVQFTPQKNYYFDETTSSPKVSSGIITEGVAFYAVGIVDETYGFEDFALDPDTRHVYTFATKEDADKYCNALNGGESSAITVSETESPLRAPGAGTYDVNHRNFQSVEFTGGKAYYRINIYTAGANMKVERNRFYKIDVKSISSLGFHSEKLLRPNDPTSDPGNSTSAWIETVLTVAPWDETSQNANL